MLSIKLKKAMLGEEEPTVQRGAGVLEYLKERPPSIVQAIEDVLESRKVEHNFFRPSMLYGCDRANVYHYQNARRQPQQQENTMLRILDVGTHIHTIVQGYLADHPDYWFAPESRVNTEINGARIRGSCDGIMVRRSDGYRFALEIKSKAHNSFIKLTKPDPQHVRQACIYAALHKVHWITILYFDKNSQHLREFPVSVDPEKWDEVQARVKHLKKYVDDKVLPRYDANTCDPSFCGFRGTCRKAGAPV